MKSIIIICLFIQSISYARINAVYNNDKVEITWTNPKGLKVQYFSIQRSKNGKYFKEIIKIKGSKNDYNINEYQEVDSKPFKKKGYYRIKQIDINGNVYYSNIIFTKKTQTEKSIFNFFSSTKKYRELKNYKSNNVLVVLLNTEKKEFIAKVDLVFENKQLIITSSDINLPTGKYLVMATSDDTIYAKQIFSEGNYFIPLQSQNIK